MHRIYLKNSLDTRSLAATNKYAPIGLKYCNGICQDFRSQTEFSATKTICRKCINTLNIAKKEIESGKLTIEQFKENPNILTECEEENVDTNLKKECKKCGESKCANQFDKNRLICKACRALEAVVRNSTGIEDIFSDVEKIKKDLHKLKTYLEGIPKDKLVQVISHYSVGRKASDTKDRMVHNCIEFFRKLLNPKLCKGGCGFELQKEFSMCLTCEKKLKISCRLEKQIQFENNIDEYMINLKNTGSITEEESYKLSVQQLKLIAKKLELKIKNATPKTDMITAINNFLKEEKEKREKEKKEITEIERREEDGYINATKICKAENKRFNDWYENKSTKKLIKKLEDKNINDIIKVNKGGNYKNQGSWIHPELEDDFINWVFKISNKKEPEVICEEEPIHEIEKEPKKDLKQTYLVKNFLDLDLDDIMREDGYINATMLCKAGNKRFNNWYRMDCTKDLIKILEEKTGLSEGQIIQIKKGGDYKDQGSWIHPKLKNSLVIWIKPEIQLEQSTLFDELEITGTVTLGKEKTEKEILELQLKLKEEQRKLKELEKKHNKILYKRQYHKFKKGPCFYIISDNETKEMKFKVGIDDVNINERLKQHRTSCPAIKIEFLVYTDKNKWLEEGLLGFYENKRKHLNREWIYDTNVSEIIDTTKQLLKLCANYNIETDLDSYNSQV